MENNDFEPNEIEQRMRYLRSISQDELFRLKDDFELCNATFQMIVRIRGTGMELVRESDIEHTIVLATMTNSIVRNGGFEALFSGEFKVDPDFRTSSDCFAAIGAHQSHAVLLEALNLTETGSINGRFDRFTSHPENIRNKLMERWIDSGPQFTTCLASFIRSNKHALRAVWSRHLKP